MKTVWALYCCCLLRKIWLLLASFYFATKETVVVTEIVKKIKNKKSYLSVCRNMWFLDWNIVLIVLQSVCRRFSSWMFSPFFGQKIGFVKQPHFCPFPSTTYQASFVWPHAFCLLMCAYSILCLWDCLSIVCETESPHLPTEDCFL